MSASAQRHDLELKLHSLRAANPVTYQVPRAAGVVLPPAQPRIDPRRDVLAAKIAKQLAGRPVQGASAMERPFKPPASTRFPLGNLFDAPTLIVSLAATGLLVGSAFAMMILSGAVDATEPEPASPEKQIAVLSASAAGKPMPGPAPQKPPATEEAQIAALPPQDLSPSEDVDASAPEDGGIGLFGDVNEVYRGDGRSGVTFGAIYDRPASGPAVTKIPDRPAQALVEEARAPADPAPPQAGEDADAEWIELPVAVNLRRGPSRSAGVIGVVEKGTRLKELERNRGWVKVIDPETQETGWLYPDSRPKARRAAKQPVKQQAPTGSQNTSAAPGPFATLGNWLGKPQQQ